MYEDEFSAGERAFLNWSGPTFLIPYPNFWKLSSSFHILDESSVLSGRLELQHGSDSPT